MTYSVIPDMKKKNVFLEMKRLMIFRKSTFDQFIRILTLKRSSWEKVVNSIITPISPQILRNEKKDE